MKASSITGLVLAATITLTACGTPVMVAPAAAGPVPGSQLTQLPQIEQIRFHQAIKSAQLRRMASEAAVERLRAVQQVHSDTLRSPTPTIHPETLRFQREITHQLAGDSHTETLRARQRVASDTLRG